MRITDLPSLGVEFCPVKNSMCAFLGGNHDGCCVSIEAANWARREKKVQSDSIEISQSNGSSLLGIFGRNAIN